MSDSAPRTDDLARGNHNVPTWWAEQLERELAEAKKDSARLDWLDKQPYAEFGDGEAGELSLHILDFEDFPEWHGRGTARDCIDAAMEDQKQ